MGLFRMGWIQTTFTKSCLVSIEYFKKYYKGIKPAQPGSAGMDGAAVVNPQEEKSKEDEWRVHVQAQNIGFRYIYIHIYNW